jgi:hypothetical protein
MIRKAAVSALVLVALGAVAAGVVGRHVSPAFRPAQAAIVPPERLVL